MPPRLPSGAYRPSTFADRVLAARRRRLRRGALLVTAGLLLLALALWGHANLTSSRLVHDDLDHPIALGLPAYALVAAGIVHLVDDRLRRIVVGVLLAGVGATGFGLAGLVISAGASHDHAVTVVTAPSGRLEAVLDDDGGQPLRTVRIVVQGTDSGLSSRRHEVACVSARGTGTPVSPVSSVTWTGDGLAVRTAGGATQRVVLRSDGAPDGVLRLGPGCS